MNDDFRKLQAPVESGMGWYITTDDGLVGWLSITGNIASDTADLSVLYFDSEPEAKYAIIKHGRVWGNTGTLDDTQVQVDITESQVMEFE